MLRWTSREQVPTGYGPSIVTLGNFDGVHRGHSAVLGAIVREAREQNERAVAVTFDPHPAQVHRPASAPPAITGLEDRLSLLEDVGLDAVLVLHYSLAFAQQSPEGFVHDYLVRPLAMSSIVVGGDIRFGRDNAGNLETMRELGKRHGFRVEVVADVADATGDVGRCSSTQVRQLLGAGDVAGAAHVLGRRHHLRGTVVHGDHRGRELGFPTANLATDVVGLVPADGVYAAWLHRASDPGRRLPAAVSIGSNPTFEGTERRVEAYVPGRTDLDLYGEQITLEMVARVRPTIRFASASALVAQMHDDVADVMRMLGTAPAR